MSVFEAIEKKKKKYTDKRYRVTTQFRFFQYKRKPMKYKNGIGVHNKAFNVKNHDLSKYPACCDQTAHFFKNFAYKENNVYYGVSKTNNSTYHSILKDALEFVNNCKLKGFRIILKSQEREPIHVWIVGNKTKWKEKVEKSEVVLYKRNSYESCVELMGNYPLPPKFKIEILIEESWLCKIYIK